MSFDKAKKKVYSKSIENQVKVRACTNIIYTFLDKDQRMLICDNCYKNNSCENAYKDFFHKKLCYEKAELLLQELNEFIEENEEIIKTN